MSTYPVTLRPHCTQNVTKYLNPWPTSLTKQVVIFSKVAACISQQMALTRDSSTHECLTGLRKSRSVNFRQCVVVISLLMELSTVDEKHSLPLCAYMWQILAKPVTSKIVKMKNLPK